ncbi:MAG TPA: hypothetical protein PLO14_11585 [Accumulibacter sp.]|nr:hypothetical protein [Accumulibacter sp.]HNC52863.1 hypothetical protein [Accumulibacter sp.]
MNTDSIKLAHGTTERKGDAAVLRSVALPAVTRKRIWRRREKLL